MFPFYSNKNKFFTALLLTFIIRCRACIRSNKTSLQFEINSFSDLSCMYILQILSLESRRLNSRNLNFKNFLYRVGSNHGGASYVTKSGYNNNEPPKYLGPVTPLYIYKKLVSKLGIAIPCLIYAIKGPNVNVY